MDDAPRMLRERISDRLCSEGIADKARHPNILIPFEGPRPQSQVGAPSESNPEKSISGHADQHRRPCRNGLHERDAKAIGPIRTKREREWTESSCKRAASFLLRIVRAVIEEARDLEASQFPRSRILDMGRADHRHRNGTSRPEAPLKRIGN